MSDWYDNLSPQGRAAVHVDLEDFVVGQRVMRARARRFGQRPPHGVLRDQPMHTPQSNRGLTDHDVVEWLSNAEQGDRLTYHIGFLFEDRAQPKRSIKRDEKRARHELGKVADRLLWAHGHGLVDLVQSRPPMRQQGVFEYHAIARKGILEARSLLARVVNQRTDRKVAA